MTGQTVGSTRTSAVRTGGVTGPALRTDRTVLSSVVLSVVLTVVAGRTGEAAVAGQQV